MLLPGSPMRVTDSAAPWEPWSVTQHHLAEKKSVLSLLENCSFCAICRMKNSRLKTPKSIQLQLSHSVAQALITEKNGLCKMGFIILEITFKRVWLIQKGQTCAYVLVPACLLCICLSFFSCIQKKSVWSSISYLIPSSRYSWKIGSGWTGPDE